MIPILGKPVMEYLIEHLASFDIREIMVNVSHHHERIENYFGNGHRWGVEIGYCMKVYVTMGILFRGRWVRPVGCARYKISAASSIHLSLWSFAVMLSWIWIYVQHLMSIGKITRWLA